MNIPEYIEECRVKYLTEFLNSNFQNKKHLQIALIKGKEIFDALQQCQDLTNLDIDCDAISSYEEDFNQVWLGLSKCQNLTTLSCSFYECWLESVSFFEGISNLPNLRTFNLSWCYYYVDKFNEQKDFFEGISKCKNVNHMDLNLQIRELDDDILIQLGTALSKCIQLETLNLSTHVCFEQNSILSQQSVFSLLNQIQKCKNLKKLKLSIFGQMQNEKELESQKYKLEPQEEFIYENDFTKTSLDIEIKGIVQNQEYETNLINFIQRHKSLTYFRLNLPSFKQLDKLTEALTESPHLETVQIKLDQNNMFSLIDELIIKNTCLNYHNLKKLDLSMIFYMETITQMNFLAYFLQNFKNFEDLNLSIRCDNIYFEKEQNIIYLKSFFSAIQSCMLLTKLTLRLNIIDKQNQIISDLSNHLANLQKLETLELYFQIHKCDEDFEFEKLFLPLNSCQNLKALTLNIYNSLQFGIVISPNPQIRNKSIRSLKIIETYFCFLDNRDISVNSFNLIKIFQGYFENLSELSFDSFNDFRQDFNSLINFASLTKLSIQSIWSLRNIKFDFWSALTNFCNLTCLELEFDEQIDEFQNMFDALSKFKSLRQFKIKSGIHNSYNEFDALIKQFSRKINCNNILNTFEFLIHLSSSFVKQEDFLKQKIRNKLINFKKLVNLKVLVQF